MNINLIENYNDDMDEQKTTHNHLLKSKSLI